MIKNFVKSALCVAVGMIFMGFNVYANEEMVVTKYKYNTVPIRQPQLTKSMMPGVQKYKAGNYVGAMVDFEEIVEKEKNNDYAKYYLALCYTQLGNKNSAEKLYNEVAASDRYALAYYSKRALVCIDNPNNEICFNPKKVTAPVLEKQQVEDSENQEETQQQATDDMTRFIQSGAKIHPHAKDLIMNEKMQRKLQEDAYKRKQLEENQDKTSYAQTPTNEEIVAALDVLSKIGLNPFTQLNAFAYANTSYNMFSPTGFESRYNPMFDLMMSNASLSTPQMMMYAQQTAQNDILNYGI